VAQVDPLLLAYLSFTSVLVLTPGSTTAVVVRNALEGGRGAGLAAAMGAAVANTSHAALAGMGLAVVFARWPAAMLALRVAGAAYLAWLGVISLRRVIRHADGGLRLLPPDAPLPPRRTAAAHAGSFRQGLAVNLLNPAIATFYLVVVPSFMPPAASPWYFALLALAHIVMAFACHGTWAVALDKVRRLFRAPLARRSLEGATAIALIALAARVLLR
jgi:threonine/homoserine/homoserine lactone efflux protein